jgi:hypothetical protein
MFSGPSPVSVATSLERERAAQPVRGATRASSIPIARPGLKPHNSYHDSSLLTSPKRFGPRPNPPLSLASAKLLRPINRQKRDFGPMLQAANSRSDSQGLSVAALPHPCGERATTHCCVHNRLLHGETLEACALCANSHFDALVKLQGMIWTGKRLATRGLHFEVARYSGVVLGV